MNKVLLTGRLTRDPDMRSWPRARTSRRSVRQFAHKVSRHGRVASLPFLIESASAKEALDRGAGGYLPLRCLRAQLVDVDRSLHPRMDGADIVQRRSGRCRDRRAD